MPSLSAPHNYSGHTQVSKTTLDTWIQATTSCPECLEDGWEDTLLSLGRVKVSTDIVHKIVATSAGRGSFTTGSRGSTSTDPLHAGFALHAAFWLENCIGG